MYAIMHYAFPYFQSACGVWGVRTGVQSFHTLLGSKDLVLNIENHCCIMLAN